MPDRCFLDSNILIYAFSETEPEKRDIARRLWQQPDAWISTQVINEVSNVLARKFQLGWGEIDHVVSAMAETLNVHVVDLATIRRAIVIAGDHPHSFFDALMLASANLVNSAVIYSEDMQHGAVIGGVRIVNPFIP